MKKCYTVLAYTLVFLCLQVVIWFVRELEHRQIFSLDMLRLTIILVAASAVIGLYSPRKWSIDWPLMILMPLSLAVTFFCIGYSDGDYLEESSQSFLYALTVLQGVPWWLYVAVTLPALLTSFLQKYIKPQSLEDE